MKEELIQFLSQNFDMELDFGKLIEKPKLESQGDFAIPMFILSKQLKKSPQDIAKDYEEKLSKKMPDFLEKIVAVGPYLNFYLNKQKEAKEVLESIANNSIFKISNKKPQKILIEYPSPNTNKALHIGHVRNILLGNSLTKIFQKTNNQIIKTNMNNDRGIAICKSMLGYKLFYSNDTPKTLNVKSDEFVSLCYVKFESESKKDENLNKLAQQTLVKWEEGDKETIQLWKKVMKWVFEGYKITYKNYKIGNYDEEYFESQIYTKGKDIVTNALKNKVKGFEQEEDGAIYCDLSDVGYDKKYLLRGDNTTLYMTQDLYLAYLKDEQFSPDLSFFIVGKDQEYHFKVLFEILERLGYGGVKKNYHFAYGYVYNRDGKKFSSRKGEVVGADWILNHIISKAKENLISKEISKNLPDAELEKRANIIGYGALAFSMLKTNPLDDICFDIDKALSFEGETGPYVQYTYARINSILKKANYKNQKDIDYSKYENKETSLIKLLKEYPQIIQEASNKYKPSHIANYLIKVSQSFNEFYQNSPILNGDKELIEPRLELCSATSRIIKEGLDLLDIQTLDEM